MTSRSFVLLLVAIGLAGTAGDAAAQKKKAVKACGITAIPLSVGNQWVYEAVAHPTPLEEAQKKLLPPQPSKITITVAKVETVGEVTTVGLTEVIESQVGNPSSAAGNAAGADGKQYKTESRTLETTLTCTKTKLDFSPDSFFFSGEPGGFWNLTVDQVVRKNTSFPINKGKLTGVEWHDDLTFAWKRNPTEGTDADLGAGTFTMDRRLVITGEESVTTAFGVYSTATKIGIETKGEITVEKATGKPYLLPEGLVTFFWLADGVGIVQVHNTFIHAYQLTGATIAK
jgi:hypothetical protein